ncbi:transcription factor TFIID complex, histone acetyltransferase subunit Taf111 [Schizosaccharomyces osmophilus]|uniref:Transcription factor TFIID complex, histone acetyltransferase subunit Taf111 n=1 Tax=Schizosaccharomyces osmophilus TaxID=2545709 RepID=A0AAE9WBQ1_9SCHI|nr:transcription factor TFIID complex, histone acetyltransferase subunit Taf111 [Schizosaccharomyces osmophilus]WBW72895.1 transcription factor TFIID complex, histone acetyltransferase subunit Taf111 [Schizosaccharomyces osmophilus]
MSFNGLEGEIGSKDSLLDSENDFSLKRNDSGMGMLDSFLGDMIPMDLEGQSKNLESEPIDLKNDNGQDGFSYEDDFGFNKTVDEGDDLEDDVSDDNLPEEEQAVNYTGKDEDEDFRSLLAKEMGEAAAGQVLSGVGFSVPAGLVDMNETPSAPAVPSAAETQNEDQIRENIVKTYFPSFKRGVLLNFSELFRPKHVKLAPPKKKTPKVCVPSRLTLEIEPDYSAMFNSKKNVPIKRDIVPAISTQSTKRRKTGGLTQRNDGLDLNTIFTTNDWEKGIIYDEKDLSKLDRPSFSIDKSLADFDLNIDDNIFEGETGGSKVVLNLNDPKLLLQPQKRDEQHRSYHDLHLRNSFSWKYNLSNDSAYEMLKQNHQSKVRNTLSQLAIEHAAFAEKLTFPYYKTRLSKRAVRSFHRPTMSFKPNAAIVFSPLNVRKKSKDKHKSERGLIPNTKDMTMGDTTHAILVEFSEEHPPVLSNVGMASRIVNYYRKKNEQDESRPKLEVGESHVLDVQDRSPFWNFGSVEPGEITPTLYNKMIRAPLFKHELPSTDFILVRNTSSYGSKYYLKNINHIFVSGQTFPVTDVPGPHSRKVTTASKNRLKMLVFRLIRRSPTGGLFIRQLSQHFSDQNEMQIRQRLKEFMEYKKKGDGPGYWKLKSNEVVPDEAGTRSMVSPETVCLLESMQVGVQQLEDAGYGKTIDEVNDDDEEEQPAEQLLAPWITTRNFINATQGKAMLTLFGEGDPTGIGEGYSFIRTSMKGGFKPAGEPDDRPEPQTKNAHAYNVAKQQQAYEEEINRIWNAQKRGLSISSIDELARKYKIRNKYEDYLETEEAPREVTPSTDKVLRIVRVYQDRNGNWDRKQEVVHDPIVIHAYLKKRREIDEQSTALDAVVPTGDEAIDRRNRKRLEQELAKSQKNWERRRARHAAKEGITINGEGKKPTTRKCSNCGQVGHMKTNKICPLFGRPEGGLATMLDRN